MMKSYTDIEQSKKLAEILPTESADQTWERVAIAGANFDVPEEMEYWHNGNTPCFLNSEIGIPCWSLAALLEVMPEILIERVKAQDGYGGYYYFVTYNELIEAPYKKELIDACVEMILHLNKEICYEKLHRHNTK